MAWKVLAYFAIGFLVSLSVETATRRRHGLPMPSFGDKDWGDTCLLASFEIAMWPVALLGFSAYFLCTAFSGISRFGKWLHPSWYLLHLPYRAVDAIMGNNRRSDSDGQ